MNLLHDIQFLPGNTGGVLDKAAAFLYDVDWSTSKSGRYAMKNSYSILIDASADLASGFALREDIHVIPMGYTLGEQPRVYACEENSPALKEMYDGQRQGLPTATTQISPQNYLDAFLPYAQRGEPVLYLCLSGGLSGTYASSLVAAREIAEDYPQAKIRCVASRAATVGIGMLAELAAANRAAGMTLEENAAWLEENRNRVMHWFMVEDLNFLKRGGRISPATAVVGTALNIKPILKIAGDGTLTNFAKVRGSRAARKRLAEYYRETGIGGEGDRILIVHADNPSGAEELRQDLLEINPKANITVSMLGPVIGCHVGPGMCACVHLAVDASARKEP